MAADKVPVTAGVGTNLQTWKNTIGLDDVHAEAVVLVASTGTELAVATEATLGTIHGHVDSIDTKVATETTLGTVHGHVHSIDGKITTCDTGAVVLAASAAAIGKLAANTGVDIGDVDVTSIAAGDTNIGNVDVVTLPTILQSTKHDSKVYAPAIFDSNASGNLVVAVANKVTKLHAMTIQAQGTVIVNLKNGAAGASLMEWSFRASEGAVMPLASAPAYWAVTSQNTILYVTLSAAVQVTITAITSSDDAA